MILYLIDPDEVVLAEEYDLEILQIHILILLELVNLHIEI